jgi:hypothetical protein
MGGRRLPGWICSFVCDDEWLNDGTNCLAQSSSTGPIGLDADAAEARAMDAAMHAKEKRPKSDDITHFMIDEDIKLIVASPFGKTSEGAEIVALLKRLNKSRDIVYADTNGARGDWDRSTIRISEEYSGKIYPTAIELVHEGTHALWRQKHAKGGNSAKETVDDEFHAQQNQLNMYRYFRDEKGYSDWQMDLRLKKLDDNTLRAGIEEGFVTH